MTHIEGSILISAPQQQVFAYASDWRTWSDWFQGVSDFRPLTEIQRGNGARYAYHARVFGFRASVETEITQFREDHGWTGVGRRGLPHTTHWLFESVGAGTRFTFAQEYHVPVPVLGSLLDAAFLRREWRRIIDASLANLRRHFEAPMAV